MIDNEAESRGWRGIAPAFFGDPGGTDFWPRGGALCRSFPGWRAGHRPDWIAFDFRTLHRPRAIVVGDDARGGIEGSVRLYSGSLDLRLQGRRLWRKARCRRATTAATPSTASMMAICGLTAAPARYRFARGARWDGRARRCRTSARRSKPRSHAFRART